MGNGEIPNWLQTWQNKFKPCIAVWKELNKRALSKRLSTEEEQEVNNLIMEYKLIDKNIHSLGMEERRHNLPKYHSLLTEKLFPMMKKIQDFWENHGYSDFLIHKEGKVGLSLISGSVIHPEYEDFNFTYDGHEFFFASYYPAKRDGKWGIIDTEENILLPFEYDMVFRCPNHRRYYIVTKDGKSGIVNTKGSSVEIVVSCEMDVIHQVPGWDLLLFEKEGKWGWWWDNSDNFYENYSEPQYDEIFIQPIEEIFRMDDEEDEVIVARKGENYHEILYWTIK